MKISDEPNAQGVLFPSLPPISPFLSRIIDRKVRGVALNIFQRIIHFFYSRYSKKYMLHFEHKYTEQGYREEAAKAKESRKKEIKKLVDGIEVFDLTQHFKVTVEQNDLLIDGKPIGLSDKHPLKFGANFQTKDIVLLDGISNAGANRPAFLEIIETKQSGQVLGWFLLKGMEGIDGSIVNGESSKLFYIYQKCPDAADASPVKKLVRSRQ